MEKFLYGTLLLTKDSVKFKQADLQKPQLFTSRDQALAALGEAGWELVSTEQPDGIATKGTLYLEMYFKKKK